MYFGNSSWKNYTYTVDAVKYSGSEGFLIPFSVGSSKENYFWNLGGWNNTVSCLQKVTSGNKSGQIAGTTSSVHIADASVYHLKVVVNGKNVKCYMDDRLMVDYTDDNILGQTEKVKLVSSKVSGVSSQFNYTVPKYSVSILRLKKKK